MNAPLDDATIMRRVIDDDTEAFATLYDRFRTRAYHVAYSVTGNRAHAEDALQEGFLGVWRSRAGFQPDRGSVAGWVLMVVRSRSLDLVRKQSRHDRHAATPDEVESRIRASGNSIEEKAGERDEAERLRTSLGRLPAAQREVIALAYFGELSSSEIANQLSLSVGTVKGRMRLGLHKLRDDPPA